MDRGMRFGPKMITTWAFCHTAILHSQQNLVCALSLSFQPAELEEQVFPLQANVDTQLVPEEWPLEALATKMKQYCYLLEDLTADMLKEQGDGDYELLRKYLRRRAVDAYWQKVIALRAFWSVNPR